MPKSIDIKELKDISNRTGIDHWTIKLVGDLERDPSLETEVKVNVLLQPFHPSDLDGYSRFPDCANEDYRSLKLGVGALPALKKGSIWYKGRLTASRFGQRADYMIDNSSYSVSLSRSC